MKKSIKKVENISSEESVKYYTIFESTGTATLLVDEDTTISMANNECSSLTGYKPEELIGTKWTTYVAPESLQEMMKYHKLRRKEPAKAPKKYEVKLIHRSGEIRNAILDVGIIPDTKQSVVSMLDITERKRLEESLKESEKRLKEAQSRVHMGSWEFDTDTQSGFWTDEMFKIFDRNPTNGVPAFSEFIKIVHPDDRKRIKNLFYKAIDEHKSYIDIYRIIRPDGSIRWIEGHGDPVLNDENKLIKLVGTSLDITDRMQFGEELREEKQKYSSLVSNLPGFVYRCKNDKNWTMIFISEGCRKITGYSPEDFINNKAISYNEIILPKYQKYLWEKWQKVLKERTTFIYEYKIRTSSGEIKWVWERGNGIYNDEGELLYLEGYIEEITERKNADLEIKRLLERLDLATRAAYMGIWDWDIQKNELLWDDRMYELYGIKREDFNGANEAWLAGIHPDDREISNKIVQDALHGKKEYETEFRVIWPDSTIKILKAYGLVVRNSKGKPLRMIGVNYDITEQKHKEDIIRKSEMQLSNALDIAHLGPWEYDVIKDEFTFNDHFYKIFHVTAEQVGGYKMSSSEYARRFIHPDDINIVVEETRLSIETTNPDYNRQLEHRIIYPDGTMGYINVLFYIIKDDKGNTIKTYGVNQDITERKKIEESLRISEEKFRKVFVTSPDSININRLDDGMYVTINNGFTQILGYTKEDVKEKTSTDLNIWDNPDDRKKLIEGIKSDGIVKNLEARFRKKNGDIQYGLMSASVIDLNGIPHIISITRDITDRKEAEEALRSSQQLIEGIINAIPIRVFWKDKNLVYMGCNTAFVHDAGFTNPEDVIGKNDFQMGWREQAELYQRDDIQVIKSGQPKLNIEEPQTTPEGKTISLLTNKIPLRNSKGEVNGVLGTYMDITERKLAEEALKKSEEKFRNLIETMPEGFYRSTPEGYFVDVNPALVKMLGFESKEELMKINIPEELYFSRNERINGVKNNIDFISDTDIYRLKKKDGSEIWVEDHSRYIQDISGKIIFHEGIMRDITESLQAQKAIIEAKEKAEEASMLKSSFLANMSHEIRTPLNGILGFAEILKNELKESDLAKYADVIEKSGRRLLETLDLILSFSKLEAEKEDVHYSNVLIENVIEEVMSSFEVMAKNKNLFLKLSVKEERLITNIDERFLRQIMNNLINNAIKYTDAGGITVTLLKENNNVVIKVEDTGIGIANEKQNVIFEEFRQESEGHGRRFEGTGLGLAITKRFVELMKGTIEVESEVGVGSIFTVTFPYEQAKQTITIKMKNENINNDKYIPSDNNENKLSILIVENDDMNLDYTIAVLEEYYNLESAVNGLEAIEKATNKVYDIILMDINLGMGMDGIEVARKIKNLQGYQKTPIVALTAFVLPGDREDFLKSGCTHYLGKPFTKNQILELLRKVSDDK